MKKGSKMDYKFNEGELIKELQAYIDSTYNQHYATDKYQATDMIIDAGHGIGFCVGNIMKYAKRYGKKGGPADQRKDLMKILHYGIILLNEHDQKASVDVRAYDPREHNYHAGSMNQGQLAVT